jgi:cysteinyl-tRNA synthetase
MDEALDEYELKKLLEHIADCITNDEYEDLNNLLFRLDRLRKKGLNVGFKRMVPVLDAYSDKISGYIKNDEYFNAENVMDRLKGFLKDFNLAMGKETASRISNAYVDKITSCIEEEQYDDAKLWVNYFKQFLQAFDLIADEGQISKIIDSYVFLVKSCIDAREFDKADELRERMTEFKNMIKPLTQKTSQEPLNDKKLKGLHCVYCGKKLPPEALFCSNCGSSQE